MNWLEIGTPWVVMSLGLIWGYVNYEVFAAWQHGRSRAGFLALALASLGACLAWICQV